MSDESSIATSVRSNDEGREDGGYRAEDEGMSETSDYSSHVFQKIPEVDIYCGTFVHATSRKNMEILQDWIIGVKETKILFSEPKSMLEEMLIKYEQDDDSVMYLNESSFMMPGFIDAHIHLPMYPFAGKAVDLTPVQWMKMYKVPNCKQLQDDKYMRNLATRAVNRTLNNGTTTAAYYCSVLESAARIVTDIVDRNHQRAILGLDLHRLEARDHVHLLQVEMAKDVIEHIKRKKNDLLMPSLTTTLPFPDDIEHKISAAQKEYNVHVQITVQATKDPVTDGYLRHWMRDKDSQIDHHHKNGLLGPKTILAHCTNCTKEDFELIRSSGASVIHCPNSNVALMRGVLDVRRMLQKNIKLGLGTDMAAGYSPSMLDAIRHCVQVSKMIKLTKTIEEEKHINNDKLENGKDEEDEEEETEYITIGHKEAFRLATLGGAEALGIDDKVGSFEVGKEFDAIIVNAHVPSRPFDLFPDDDIEDTIEKFLFIGDDRNITHVFVAGRRVK